MSPVARFFPLSVVVLDLLVVAVFFAGMAFEVGLMMRSEPGRRGPISGLRYGKGNSFW